MAPPLYDPWPSDLGGDEESSDADAMDLADW
jgi:hypothetical protein